MSTNWRYRRNSASIKWRLKARQHGSDNRKFGTFSWHVPVSKIADPDLASTHFAIHNHHEDNRHSSIIPCSQPGGHKQKMHRPSQQQMVTSCPTGKIGQMVLPTVVVVSSSTTAITSSLPLGVHNETDSSAVDTAIDDWEHENVDFLTDDPEHEEVDLDD